MNWVRGTLSAPITYLWGWRAHRKKIRLDALQSQLGPMGRVVTEVKKRRGVNILHGIVEEILKSPGEGQTRIVTVVSFFDREHANVSIY
ncbi:unnamed protein product [Arabidopsis thaliana]|uniref:Uncharacterized protein n=1 Tax=Arabidopsis thaliana TaxID=3702 RepID=A0A654FCG2_ARATH|nr:unnamed protein product [Arabidopsis thaliana]